MKKALYTAIILLSFMICQNVSAAAVCDLQNQELWTYATTLYGRAASDEINNADSKYDYSYCCNMSNGTQACDFYMVVNTSSESNQNTNTETNVTSNTTNYCEGLKDTFTIIGHIVRLAKILIPIIIIGFGMLDLFKAVVGSKDDEIKKTFKSLIMRCIAGVCIFFLPAFIDLIFGWVDGWETTYQGSYEECFKCIWDVGSCK